jgi:hypothetical protein
MTKKKVFCFFSFFSSKSVVLNTTYAAIYHLSSTPHPSPPTPFPDRRPRSNPARLDH